mgnify:CR=1 FL=1|tara:strand:+ start:525 stop:770 length:246 start_codon:yes stop_codon:yes gene_type:complete
MKKLACLLVGLEILSNVSASNLMAYEIGEIMPNFNQEYSEIRSGNWEQDGKEDIRKNLLNYCGLDTEGMVWIVNELKKLVK